MLIAKMHVAFTIDACCCQNMHVCNSNCIFILWELHVTKHVADPAGCGSYATRQPQEAGNPSGIAHLPIFWRPIGCFRALHDDRVQLFQPLLLRLFIGIQCAPARAARVMRRHTGGGRGLGCCLQAVPMRSQRRNDSLCLVALQRSHMPRGFVNTQAQPRNRRMARALACGLRARTPLRALPRRTRPQEHAARVIRTPQQMWAQRSQPAGPRSMPCHCAPAPHAAGRAVPRVRTPGGHAPRRQRGPRLRCARRRPRRRRRPPGPRTSVARFCRCFAGPGYKSACYNVVSKMATCNSLTQTKLFATQFCTTLLTVFGTKNNIRSVCCFATSKGACPGLGFFVSVQNPQGTALARAVAECQ